MSAILRRKLGCFESPESSASSSSCCFFLASLFLFLLSLVLLLSSGLLKMDLVVPFLLGGSVRLPNSSWRRLSSSKVTPMSFSSSSSTCLIIAPSTTARPQLVTKTGGTVMISFGRLFFRLLAWAKDRARGISSSSKAMDPSSESTMGQARPAAASRLNSPTTFRNKK